MPPQELAYERLLRKNLDPQFWYQTILSEITVATTHCRAAMSTEHLFRKKWNLAQAEESCRIAADLGSRAALTADMKFEAETRIAHVRFLLEKVRTSIATLGAAELTTHFLDA